MSSAPLTEAVYTREPSEREREVLSQQEREAAEKFLRQMQRAGARVASDTGDVGSTGAVPITVTPVDQVRYTDDAQVSRTFIDIDIDDTDIQYIVLRNRSTGQEQTVTIPPIATGAAFLIGKYQDNLARKFKELSRANTEREVQRLNQEMLNIQEQMVRLVVPDLPRGLLATLKGRAFKQFMGAVEESVALALGQETSPLAYIRQAYARAGYPDGKTDEGLVRWLRREMPMSDDEDDRPN